MEVGLHQRNGEYTLKNKILGLVLILMYCSSVNASTERYNNVANQFKGQALSDETVSNAMMQGACLVQLKELTFKKKNDFDPISEWVNYRSISLLEQYSPCETLIILEVANTQLRESHG